MRRKRIEIVGFRPFLEIMTIFGKLTSQDDSVEKCNWLLYRDDLSTQCVRYIPQT